MLQWIKRHIIGQLPAPDQRPVARRRQEAESPYADGDQPMDPFSHVPPGYIPIESGFDMADIPGTTLYIGDILKILHTPTGELVNLHLKRGARLGCGHSIFSVHEYLSESGVYSGLGGRCPFCSAIAAAKLRQGELTLAQAEAASHFCSRCASYCDDCHRAPWLTRNLCRPVAR